MSKVIITGVTGNAGSAILSEAIASPSVSQILVLSRRPPYESSEKLKHIQIPSAEYPKGFEEIPERLVDEIRRDGYTSCIWALGISQIGLKEDEYTRITHDYTLTSARAFSTLGTPASPFKFIYISGEGARQDENSSQLFARVKGRTEKALMQLARESGGKFEAVNLRPGGINPTLEHLPRMGFWAGRGLRWSSAVLNPLLPRYVINSSDLGKASVGLVAGQGWEKKDAEGVIFNLELREMAKAFSQAEK
ncbi:hypothetical protein I316_03279 [Kwoniella heveanensis BCC8398]|uniref:NAD(P)-binding domain-containing protein n=1 Tax=Kwoniella heveanensis BCC8398 TaxID=1296120 RepID=A0A1B9GW38_9TREE|nr:hypothetical protein I316_03279 [Kwoniella heveanensis BCC8398]